MLFRIPSTLKFGVLYVKKTYNPHLPLLKNKHKPPLLEIPCKPDFQFISAHNPNYPPKDLAKQLKDISRLF